MNLLKIKQLSFISKYWSVAHLKSQKSSCLYVATGYLFCHWLPSFGLLMIIFCLVTGNFKDAFDFVVRMGEYVLSNGLCKDPRVSRGAERGSRRSRLLPMKENDFTHSFNKNLLNTDQMKEGRNRGPETNKGVLWAKVFQGKCFLIEMPVPFPCKKNKKDIFFPI